MKILVTGGAGFIGGEVIRQAIDLGHTIINIDKLTYASNTDSLKYLENNKAYTFFNSDICNLDDLVDIFKKEQPDSVMHLAAESHVDNSINSPDVFIHTNVEGTFNILQASRNYFEGLNEVRKAIFKFHHISTDEVYGDLRINEPAFTESNAYQPSSPYSASKASSDHFVRAWHRTYNLPVVITNCSNNYGPWQYPEKLIPRLIFKALNGEPLPVFGNGMQIRDWLHVSDHAKALLRVIQDGKIGETYNIGGHNEKKNIDVIMTICSLLEEFAPKKPSNVNNYKDLITYVDDRPGHDNRYAVDASKIQRDLDWTPNETFESGIRTTVKWYVDNIDWLVKLLKNES